MSSELEQLRQEAEQLKNQIRVSTLFHWHGLAVSKTVALDVVDTILKANRNILPDLFK